MMLSSKCDVVLFVVLVHRCLISRLVAVFVQFILKDQLQSIVDSIRKHEHFSHFYFIILFVGINLLLYVVNLFAYSSFSFLAMLNLYLHLMYSVNYWNEWISLFFSKKKNLIGVYPNMFKIYFFIVYQKSKFITDLTKFLYLKT
jgi:hypothetical protein